MSIEWIKCESDDPNEPEGTWCPLNELILDDLDYDGVYIIWFDGTPPNVVYVGQGNIKERLNSHIKNRKIQSYSRNGTLLVTWAIVPSKFLRLGIERFLANHYDPLIGSSYPDVDPISVNLPSS